MCFLEFDIDIILGCFHPFLVGKNTKLLKIFEIILNFLRQIHVMIVLCHGLMESSIRIRDLFYLKIRKLLNKIRKNTKHYGSDLKLRKFKQGKFLIDAFHITLTTNVWVIQLTTFCLYCILWELSKALILEPVVYTLLPKKISPI